MEKIKIDKINIFMFFFFNEIENKKLPVMYFFNFHEMKIMDLNVK
jgi:hypothetical protein